MLKRQIAGNTFSADSYVFTNSYHRNRVVMAVKPAQDIFLDGRPEHNEICSIVWTPDGKRKVKFINHACPNHRKVECLIEPVY